MFYKKPSRNQNNRTGKYLEHEIFLSLLCFFYIISRKAGYPVRIPEYPVQPDIHPDSESDMIKSDIRSSPTIYFSNAPIRGYPRPDTESDQVGYQI